ncbi:MAG TPA: hypothetical protein VJT84_10375 [Gaiellaceae bacterium]|nr:hypothetical protein [Gaiellaceae bacterium]
MDMRRFLPILLIAFAALFILPQIFKGSSSDTLSSDERGLMTRDAMERIDRGQKKIFTSSGKYTEHLAELVAADKTLASELTVPLVVELSVSANGKSYLATVTSDVISVSRARVGTKLLTRTCRELKSRSAECPKPAAKTTTTTTTPTTTGT